MELVVKKQSLEAWPHGARTVACSLWILCLPIVVHNAVKNGRLGSRMLRAPQSGPGWPRPEKLSVVVHNVVQNGVGRGWCGLNVNANDIIGAWDILCVLCLLLS